MQDPLRTKVPRCPSPPSAIHSQGRGALKLEPTLLTGPAVLSFLGLPQHPPPRFSWGGDRAPLQPLAPPIPTLHAERKQKCPGTPPRGSKRKLSPGLLKRVAPTWPWCDPCPIRSPDSTLIHPRATLKASLQRNHLAATIPAARHDSGLLASVPSQLGPHPHTRLSPSPSYTQSDQSSWLPVLPSTCLPHRS